MMTLPLADARAQLSKLVHEASSTHERIEITKNGHRAAVLMGIDDYDAMRDTIDVLCDHDLLRTHLRGQQDLAASQGLDGQELSDAMRNVGRGVNAK